MQQPPPENELKWEYLRLSGPGGQHRNKSFTGVRLSHLPTGITVLAGERRSRAQNRAVALKRLTRRLAQYQRPIKPRRPSKPSAAARAKRLEAKRRRARLKAQRRSPGPSSLDY